MLLCLEKLKDLVLSNKVVFSKIRPLIAGLPDYRLVCDMLDLGDGDIVVDIGCGYGIALEYMNKFDQYHGFDTNQSCIQGASSKYNAPNIHFYNKALDAEELSRLMPTKAVAVGLLHHLLDAECKEMLNALENSSVTKIVTLDTMYSGKWINDFFSRLDRGKYARTTEGYAHLFGKYHYKCLISPSSNPYIHYYVAEILFDK